MTVTEQRSDLERVVLHLVAEVTDLRARLDAMRAQVVTREIVAESAEFHRGGTGGVWITAGENWGSVRVATADLDEAPHITIDALQDAADQEKPSSGDAMIVMRIGDADRVLIEATANDEGNVEAFIDTSPAGAGRVFAEPSNS